MSSNSRFQIFNSDTEGKPREFTPRKSAYVAPPLDILSLLTPSAKSKYVSTTPDETSYSRNQSSTSSVSSTYAPQSSVSKTIFLVKSSDGSGNTSTGSVRKSVHGRSGIYSALEASLNIADDVLDVSDAPGNGLNDKKNDSDIESGEDNKFKRLKIGRKAELHKLCQEMIDKPSEPQNEFQSVRSRIKSINAFKSKATCKLVPTPEPAEEFPVEAQSSNLESSPALVVRKVSYGSISKLESVKMDDNESEDSGCDANDMESMSSTSIIAQKHREPSVTSIDSALGPGSPMVSSSSPEFQLRNKVNRDFPISEISESEDMEEVVQEEDEHSVVAGESKELKCAPLERMQSSGLSSFHKPVHLASVKSVCSEEEEEEDKKFKYFLPRALSKPNLNANASEELSDSRRREESQSKDSGSEGAAMANSINLSLDLNLTMSYNTPDLMKGSVIDNKLVVLEDLEEVESSDEVDEDENVGAFSKEDIQKIDGKGEAEDLEEGDEEEGEVEEESDDEGEWEEVEDDEEEEEEDIVEEIPKISTSFRHRSKQAGSLNLTPGLPVVAKVERISASPDHSSESDESDKDWKAKIMSSRNIMSGAPYTAPPSAVLRPLVSTIMEGDDDLAEEDSVPELPSFNRGGPKFGRQFSAPVPSTQREETEPLQPARRRKTQESKSTPVIPTSGFDLDFDDLNKLQGPTLQSPFKSSIRPQRRNVTSSNPVKQRNELEQRNLRDNAELSPAQAAGAAGKADGKSAHGVHWSKAKSDARLAASAINGLQMKIDFASAALQLRKTEKKADGSAKVSKAAGEESSVESKFPEKMLLQLKGRKNVQCALVDCKVSSLNSGDVFILLNQTELFHFVGQEANVHEKAKGNDLIDRIVRNKEMGCTALKCITLHERDMDMSKPDFKRFFQLLGGRPPIAEKDAVIDDREFERRFQEEARISIFKDEDDHQSVPEFVQVSTGKRLKYDMLDSKETFLLDFITEYYVWCGKSVPISSRKKALQLAEEEYQKSKKEQKEREEAVALNPDITPPVGRRTSVAMTAGALTTTTEPVGGCSRRVSCAAMSGNKRRISAAASNHSLTQRSISSDNVTAHTGRRVSLSVNSGRATLSKVASADNISRTSISSGSRRQSVASQVSTRRVSTATRRVSTSQGGGFARSMSCTSTTSLPSCSSSSSSRRSSIVHHGTDPNKPGGGRRVSVSTKQLRSLVTGSGRRIQNEVGKIQVERPDWGINTVTIQGKEPISLREKFSDWPEPGRIIKMKGHAACDDEKKVAVATMQPLEPYDAELMHKPPPSEEVLKLEFTKLGRGRGTFKSANDEEITVITDDVKIWLVHEYKNYVLPSSYQHMLYSTEGYVVRWEYHLEEFDGFVRKNKSKRCAYYFWQGSECEINLKGATALMTVELDKEKGPQIRVVQNREPPSFLNLFRGKMVIRSDRRDFVDSEPCLGRRNLPDGAEMFAVRGECEEEGHLLQVKACTSSLRSRGCFVIVSPEEEIVYCWQGSKSTSHLRDVAVRAARHIEDNYIVGQLSLEIVEERKEPGSLISLLGGYNDYHPLYTSPDSHIYTPRLFHFHATSGKFVAEEVLCKHRVPDRDTQFPFIQDDLYSANQPALFLLDAKYQLWLWQGWFECSDDAEKVTGSAKQLFARTKKVAMETVNNYVEEMMLAENPKVYPIEAGHEPMDFITLFPFWNEREEILKFVTSKAPPPIPGSGGRRTSINTAYRMLTKSQYTIEELTSEEKPEGVDPTRLEDYLSDEEFFSVFAMIRPDFEKLPKWKQVNLKRMKKLY